MSEYRLNGKLLSDCSYEELAREWNTMEALRGKLQFSIEGEKRLEAIELAIEEYRKSEASK